MSDPVTNPEAAEQDYLVENQRLRDEINKLNREIKRSEREIKIANSFLDKVTKAATAKDTLNNALLDANVRQRAYTDMLLQSCPNIIILFDKDGRLVLSTEALMSATNTPNFDYIKGRKLTEVFPKYFSADGIEDFYNAFMRTCASASSEVIRFESLVDFELSGQPKLYSVEMSHADIGATHKDNVMYGVLVVMVDITDFIREKQRAEDANNAKSHFLATMSHEIRTPMNAIIGMSEMLDRSEMTDKQKKYISDIRKASSALLSIINDILDFSKIESGKMDLINSNFNFLGLLDHLYSMFSMLCAEKRLDLEFRVSENVPESIFGDELRIRQIFTNLLSNAVKYTKKGGVSFSVWQKDAELQFEVKDTGVGIREEDKDKLFKPFEQLDIRKNRNVVGTGLGLTITHNLCQIMNGELWFDSVYGEGSVFRVRLPYTQTEQTALDETDEVIDFLAPTAKVLVVDDIDINLTVVEALLSAFGIVPDLARRGKDAIDLAKKTKYDIIFMDHMMPEMDGLETTTQIRKIDDWNSKTPVIALTANAITGVKQIFLDNQLNDFLSKPLEISTLNRCLRKWLPSGIIEEINQAFSV